MATKAHFKILGVLDFASRASRATVTIDRASHIFSVRPHKRRRVYELPLDVVAGMVVRKIVIAEINIKRAAKKAARGRR